MVKHAGFLDVDDGRLYYETEGSGSTIVLIHGMGLDSKMWDEQFEFKKDFHVIRYDVRGYGQSSLPGHQRYSHQNDLKQLLDFVGVTDVNLVGLSMGGSIAINFALDFPDAVASLVLSNSGLDGYMSQESNSDLIKMYEEIEKYVRTNDLVKARELWLSLPHYHYALQQTDVKDKTLEMTNSYSFWHFANDNPLIRSKVQAKDRLKEITQPCLVLTGELDLSDFKEIGEILSSDLRDCRKHQVPNVGHITNMENSKIFNEIVINFLLHP